MNFPKLDLYLWQNVETFSSPLRDILISSSKCFCTLPQNFCSLPKNVFVLLLKMFCSPVQKYSALLFENVLLSSKCFVLLLNIFALLLLGARWLRHNWRLEISDPTFILWTHPTPKRNHLSDVSPFYSLYAFSSIFFHFIQFYPI